jgi:hypothetical protein
LVGCRKVDPVRRETDIVIVMTSVIGRLTPCMMPLWFDASAIEGQWFRNLEFAAKITV